jgi:hypothetical protein
MSPILEALCFEGSGGSDEMTRHAKPGSRKLNQNRLECVGHSKARFSAAQLCCNCLRRKGNTAWATAPGSSANGQCPLSGKIFISARGKIWR